MREDFMEKLHGLISNMSIQWCLLPFFVKLQNSWEASPLLYLRQKMIKKLSNRNTYTVYVPHLCGQDGLKCATINLAKYDVRQSTCYIDL